MRLYAKGNWHDIKTVESGISAESAGRVSLDFDAMNFKQTVHGEFEINNIVALDFVDQEEALEFAEAVKRFAEKLPKRDPWRPTKFKI